MRRDAIAALACAAWACAAGAGVGQEVPGDANPPTPWLESEDVAVSVDSGLVRAAGEGPQVVFSTDIVVDGAPWLRLRFDEAMLPGDPRGASGAYLAITSHLDGAVQFLGAEHLAQWQNSSAYFNGDAVTVDLIAVPGTGDARLVMTSVIAGVGQGGAIASICDGFDDRLPSDDPRAARALPVGCTAWLIDDCQHCLLTAGHCQGGASIIEFNVPLSNGEGGILHPPPEDQYAADPASLQGNGGQGVGNDWAYFGCFPNPNTGLTPAEAQGDYYVLAESQPPVQGQDIRITGYGTTGNQVPPEWNLAQKTHTGPFVTSSGSLVQYRTDTTGGNSGSPVIDESTGMAIGIHTHGGCNDGGGANSGTGISHPGLIGALAVPAGVCECPGLEFEFPSGRPDVIDPAGGTTMLVAVGGGEGITPPPGTGVLHVDSGVGFVAIPMSQISENLYEATFPAVTCLAPVAYYVSAESTDEEVFTSPTNAPGESYPTVAASGVEPIAMFDLEQDAGWTVGAPDDDATTGVWERGNPIGTAAQPENDHTEGGTDCYFTGQGTMGGDLGENDVDNGKTSLTSPAFDLEGAEAVELSYWRWYSNTTGGAPNADIFVVQASDDDGATWQTVEITGPDGPGTNGGWTNATIRLTDFVEATSSVRVRFVASDESDPSLVEAAVDDIVLTSLLCGASCPADFNGDGELSVLDFVAFQIAFVGGDDSADFNGDGELSVLDFVSFQVAFVAGC